MLSRDQFAHKGDSLIYSYNKDKPNREQFLKYGINKALHLTISYRQTVKADIR